MMNSEQYLTKAVAAKQLDLSVRRVMEMSAAGRLPRHKRFDPATQREAVMFRAADVAKLKAEKTPRPVDLPALPEPAASGISTMVDRIERSASAIVRAASVPPPSRPWLTLAEAAEYSGLPESFLHAMIDQGTLPALDVGVRPGGRYRVRRSDLDGIEGTKRSAVSDQQSATLVRTSAK
jgi:excisionase family DNA binding protein